ncbi:MAG TPA: DUF2239 family protein [Burkholderiaceae bacterium]
MDQLTPYSGFHGVSHIASGSLGQVARTVKALFDDAHGGGALIFDNATGRLVDVDFRGSETEVLARLPVQAQAEPAALPEDAPRGPGRPKLGVVAKEVTLLPRHWEWLAAQPGGASVALRKLVEEARRASAEHDKTRLAQERAYRFMSAMLANEAGLEEAQRALFAGKRAPFQLLSESWPADLREHVRRLAADAFAAEGADS